MKYIVFKLERKDGSNQPAEFVPVLFPDKMNHKSVADQIELVRVFTDYRENHWMWPTPVSAGFFIEGRAAGRSESMNLESRPEDAALINAYLKTQAMELSLKTFSETNRRRAMRWHKGGLDTWTVERWSNALAGEAGEVCNAVKKLNRIEDNMQQNDGPQSLEEAKAHIRKEIGDVYAYLDLLAQRIGSDLETCATEAFNQISEREGFPERM